MSPSGAAWTVGGYLVGTFPSTLVVARLRHAGGLIAEAGRSAGETDPHILMVKHLGAGWSAAAATMDVLKAFVFVLLARYLVGLPWFWVAAVGVAVVLGHSFPFYARDMAGRGMAASAGVLLAVMPLEMVIAGVIILLGVAIRNTGLATTVGMASVPIVAHLQSQPVALIAMSLAILGILMARRLEGVGDVIASGVRPGRAVLYRCVFDSSGPPPEPPAEFGTQGHETPRT